MQRQLTKVLAALLIACVCLRKEAKGQTACSGSQGSSSERSSRSAVSGDQRFLVASKTFQCHGQIDKYQFYRRYPYCGEFQFQIWRPVDVAHSRYMLLGTENYINSPACYYYNYYTYTRETKTLNPREIDEVPVQPGDVYGWSDSSSSSTTRTLTYNSAPTGSGTYDTVEILKSGVCTTGIGLVCDWSGAKTVVRDYNVKLYLRGRQNPYFTNLPATTQMLERSPVGTYVYRVIGWNHFSYRELIDPDIRFSLVGGTCGYTRFGINPITGVINITSVDALNHEASLSGSTSRCTVSVRVSEGPFTGRQDLTINIEDVNEPHTVDNLPAEKVINAATTGNDYLVHDVSITDVDTNRITVFPDKTYRIEYCLPENAPFDIDSYGRVRTTQSLSNWPGPTRFILGITVEDDTHHDGPHQLTIEISNLRTNPIITNVDHTISVPENSAAANTKVFQVEGDSQPDTRGDPVRFYLMHIYPLDTAVDTFSIDATTGWVTHKANPGFDYFGTRIYDLELEVRDSDNMYVSERKNLSIEITWVNKPPEITTTFTSTIDEKVPILTVLPDVYLDGTDRDIVVGDWIDYQIYGTDSYLFHADNITNRIYVAQEITVPAGRTQTVYNLRLLVYDSHGENDVTSLTVTVLDINDHQPVCDPDHYTGSIKETAPGGTTAGVTVTCTDQDGGDNRQIEYFIVEDLGNLYFQVDEVGRITNKQPIAYDKYHNITLTVLAADKGEPSLNDTATVFIEIVEVNTHEPFYNEDFYSLDLRSDTRIGTEVHVIPALDRDSDSVQEMTFSWISIQDYFSLNAQTGALSVARELVPFQTHLLYTVVTDSGSTSHMSDAYSIRIDTYLPETTLIDIYLDITLEKFVSTVDTFMSELDNIVAPWDMRLESYRLADTSTVARVYAVESDRPDTKLNQDVKKVFIHADKLLAILRKNLQGDPRVVLLGEEFAPWKPYLVQPAYPVWITDTVAGVVFLSCLCLLALTGFITMLVLLSKKYRWGCYRYRPNVKKRRVYPADGDTKHFKLNYLTDMLPVPYFISTNKLLGNTYSGLFPPSSPDSAVSKPNTDTPSKWSKARASLVTQLANDRSLTPVQTPDVPSSGRPSPVNKGGVAA